MNKDNLFWGVVFLMAAIYILMRSVGMAPDVSIVRIIIGLLCITGFIKAAIDLEFGGMLFSLAILFIVFRRYIGLESMSSWSILMAAKKRKRICSLQISKVRLWIVPSVEWK